jgi:glyoxylate reductase
MSPHAKAPQPGADRNPPRVVVTRTLPGDSLSRIRAEYDVWEWRENRPIPRDVLLEQVADASALLCMPSDIIDKALIDAATMLRVVSQYAAGLDNIDVARCTEANILVGHTPDVLTETTADSAFALLASLVRRLIEGADYVRSGQWEQWDPGMLIGGDLHGTVLGIFGMGRIGAAVARRTAGFGMRICYVSPHRKPDAERETGAVHVRFTELLSQSDHIILTAPLLPSTYHVVGREAFAKMKPSATLVNVARGGLVDHSALAEALSEPGGISGAALDVTEPEPIPFDHPLVGMRTCIITPHIASASFRTRRAMAELASRNVLAALAGVSLPACANPQAGFKLDAGQPRFV